ncbi:hypothetical protein C4561_04125 [candidate division WWE3 bacterium]|jgi:hypothetical protein|uniref:Uncharacterized protein n=1 Tax=candidate division WWE3 bacterium TaxID=2053526 RepID=A0A3A4ZK61_UNCKA|nr:MAG: hypothetical protein C4561_04125 [candidate division WWE3 bacterium]
MSEKINSLIPAEDIPEIYIEPNEFEKRTNLEGLASALDKAYSAGTYISKAALEAAGYEHPEHYIFARRFEGKGVPDLTKERLERVKFAIEENFKLDYPEQLKEAIVGIEEYFKSLSMPEPGAGETSAQVIAREKTLREIDLIHLRHESTHWQQDKELDYIKAVIALEEARVTIVNNVDLSQHPGGEALDMLTRQVNATLAYTELEAFLAQYIGRENSSEAALRFTASELATLGVVYLYNQSGYKSEEMKRTMFLMNDSHVLAALAILTEDVSLVEKARHGEVDIGAIDEKVASALEKFIQGDNLVPENLLNESTHSRVHKHLVENAAICQNLAY